MLSIPFCVRLYKTICLYFTRYPVSERENVCWRVLLLWEFVLDLCLRFSASMCGYTVLCTSCHAVSSRAVNITSTLDNVHVSWFLVGITRWCSWRTFNMQKGGTLMCDWAEAPMEQYLSVKSPGAGCVGQYSCVTGVRHWGSSALQRFTLTHGFLEQWPWKSVQATIHQCH